MLELVHRKPVNTWAENQKGREKKNKQKLYSLCRGVINLGQDKNNFKSFSHTEFDD